ncbi:MAG: hypothetical protein IKH77_07730 [Clostridia bacterium]|nr:hypothetical protein [Clostridia bacterium]
MYKKQMTFQRAVCLLTIVASAIVFLYSLGMMTDLYDMLYTMIPDPTDLDSAKVAGARIYYDMQDFNRMLLRLSIGLILLAAALFVTNTHSRRKYYIGNYVTVALNAVAGIGVAAWGHIQVMAYRQTYLNTVDFEQLERRLRSKPGVFTRSTFWFDVNWFVFGFMLVAVCLLILNTVWKIHVMKDEQRLLAEGKAVSA